MITSVVNTTAYVPFTLLDSMGSPETGKVNGDFSASAFLASTPATTATVTVTEVSGGRYVLSFAPSSVGTWFVTWSVSVDGETVRYEETVQVVTASQDDPVAYLRAQSLTVQAPTLTSDNIQLYQGDDYQTAESRQLIWQLDGAPDLTGATATLRVSNRSASVEVTGTISDAGESSQTVTVALTAAQTNLFDGGDVTKYDLSADLANNHHVTLARGNVAVVREIT